MEDELSKNIKVVRVVEPHSDNNRLAEFCSAEVMLPPDNFECNCGTIKDLLLLFFTNYNYNYTSNLGCLPRIYSNNSISTDTSLTSEIINSDNNDNDDVLSSVSSDPYDSPRLRLKY